METWLVWSGATVIGVTVVGWLTYSIFPKIGETCGEVLDWIELRLPRFLSPLEHAALTLLIILISTFAMLFPTRAPWSLFPGVPRDNGQALSLLGASAALLALLMFAANQVRAVEKDVATGERYLGINVDTFPVLRSRVIGILGLPIFHFAIVLLFVLPVAVMLPLQAIMPNIQTLIGLSIDGSKQAISAIWGACFAVVGGALILNVVTVLRISTARILRPWTSRLGVEQSLLRQTGRDMTALLAENGHEAIGQWAYKNIGHAAALPNEEQQRYLELTLDGSSFGWNRASQLTKFKSFEKKLKSLITKNERSTSGIRKALHDWRTSRLLQSAHDTFDSANNLLYGRSLGILRWLNAPGQRTVDELHSWLVALCLRDAVTADTECAILFGINPTAPGDSRFENMPAAMRHARATLLRPANAIPTIDGRTRCRPSYEEEQPEVEFFPVFVYRSLIEALLKGSNYGSPTNIAPNDLKAIFNWANNLKDLRTRELIVGELMMVTLEKTVADRVESESLERGLLRTMIPGHPSETRRPQVDASIGRSLEEIAEISACRILVSVPARTPELLSELLAFIRGWRLPAIFLFLLFCNHRPGSPMNAALLRCFRQPLHDRRYLETSDWENEFAEAHSYMSSTRARDLFSTDDLKWLYTALGTPLGPQLCLDFLRQRDQGTMRDFGLTQFVQWHILMSGPTYDYYEEHFESVALDHRRWIGHAIPQIQEFENSWQLEDASAACRLQSLIDRLSAIVAPD